MGNEAARDGVFRAKIARPARPKTCCGPAKRAKMILWNRASEESVMQAQIRIQQARRHARRGLASLASLASLACALALAGCANPWQEFQAGAPENALVARLGPPKETYTLPNGNRRLMWPTQPMGETTTAADIGPDGRALAIQQVLTATNFAQAVPQVWTQHDVLIHFGKPEETAYFPLMKREVWSYRYVESNIWYMLYHFYFDDQGVLQMTQKSMDPLHDEDRTRF
jgi:hypothetical protein